jgi:hypothetical protein
LITDDGRLFYGDTFHLGYFPQGDESLGEALDAHTDLVAELARVKALGGCWMWAAGSPRRRYASPVATAAGSRA